MRTAAAFVLSLGVLRCTSYVPPTAFETEPIIYGTDGRLEYFEVADPSVRALVARSTVALVPNRWLSAPSGTLATDAPTAASADSLCADEAFAGEPGVAFCSGVLVDFDLVLTAGHCLRLLALHDFSIVFGYYYSVEGALALDAAAISTPSAIVSEALDGPGADPRLDYAWVRLSNPVGGDYAPAPLYRQAPPLLTGAALVTVGSPHGTPSKVDAASVTDLRRGTDYFVADADTSGGWSGGGAFDAHLALVGILSRGSEDLDPARLDCGVEAHADTIAAAEEFTLANAALAGLCEADPGRSLCAATCEEPCTASPPLAPPRENGVRAQPAGCQVSPSPAEPHEPTLFFSSIIGSGLLRALLRRRRRRHRAPDRTPRTARQKFERWSGVAQTPSLLQSKWQVLQPELESPP